MKKKFYRNSAPQINAPTQKASPANNQGEQFPPALLYFSKLQSKPPHEFITELFPKLKGAKSNEINYAVQAISGLVAGFSLNNLDAQIPEWVKNASTKCLAGFLEIDIPNLESGKYSEIGKMLGLIQNTPLKDAPSKLSDAAKELVQFFRIEAAKSSAKDAKEFFAGFEIAEKRQSQNANPAQRTKVYAVIAIAWREVEKFQSAGELHRWLLEHKVILPQTDAAETRTICRNIGLRFCDKAGRPPKKK